jgi:hypothetical protein
MRFLRFMVLLAAGACALAAAPTPPSSGDAPMKMIKTDLPGFPVVANAFGLRRGEAVVAIAVDETGRLKDYLVIGYSHRAFADVSVAAIKHWRFEPMWIHGVPRGAVAILRFNFEIEGTMVKLKLVDDDLAAPFFHSIEASSASFRACRPHELDRIPTPITIVQPSSPPGVGQHGPAAQITVKYYIDEQGHVRLPRISAEALDAREELAVWSLADAAIEAVSQWQFEPPLSKGKPTIVLVEQDFVFPKFRP